MAAVNHHDRRRTIHSNRPTPPTASHHYPAELHYIKSLFLSAQYRSCILACRDILAQVRYSSAGTHARSNSNDDIRNELSLSSDNEIATSATHHQSLSPTPNVPLQDTFVLFYTALSHDALARSGDAEHSFASARHFYTAALESLPASSDGAEALYLLAGLAGRERTERLSTATVTKDGDETITLKHDLTQFLSHSRSTSDQTTRGPSAATAATVAVAMGHEDRAARNDSPMMDQVIGGSGDRRAYGEDGGKRMDAMVGDEDFYDNFDDDEDDEYEELNHSDEFPWLSQKHEQEQQHQRYDSALSHRPFHTTSWSHSSNTSTALPRDYSRMSLLDEFPPPPPAASRAAQGQQQRPPTTQPTSTTATATALPLRLQRKHLESNHQHHHSLPRLSLVTPSSSDHQQRVTTTTIFPPSATSTSASVSAVSTTSSHLRRWSEFPPASASVAASGATATTQLSRFTNTTSSSSRYHDALWDLDREEPEPVSPLTAEEYFRSEQAELQEKLERLERKRMTRASLGDKEGGRRWNGDLDDDEEDDIWTEEEERVSPVSPVSPATPVGGVWAAGTKWVDARREDALRGEHGGEHQGYFPEELQRHEHDDQAAGDYDEDYDCDSTDESQTFHDARDHARSLSSPSSAFTSTFPSPVLSATTPHAAAAAARTSQASPETDAATAARARRFKSIITEMRDRITHHLSALADAENTVAERAAEREWQSKLKYEQIPVMESTTVTSVDGTASMSTKTGSSALGAPAAERKTSLSLSERILAGRARAWLKPRFRPERYRALCEGALADL